MDDKMLELRDLCGPIVEHLKRFNPYTSIVITGSSIKVEETQTFIPVNEKND